MELKDIIRKETGQIIDAWRKLYEIVDRFVHDRDREYLYEIKEASERILIHLSYDKTDLSKLDKAIRLLEGEEEGRVENGYNYAFDDAMEILKKITRGMK